ncbi:FAR1 DNA binding domain, Zinc finger, SWIM-type, MULE transposase domain, FHY3/FAR1 family [Artemisia annua]|uniref:FAR1 DNA binding domain, Zinc finger, SWIM-type, MULE transposase domain, FHY3/FAR1 family n=1 Tax=Artemisia annua TaxID=35608 RepID=A0A2U1MDV3_ARTAN|nr:FAR1 DNA binding domain, Zinc finger, SWIM-type, MULE transposase domain, FHY3/FAR1 family [Artemisia annua]
MAIFDLNQPAVSVSESSINSTDCLALVVYDNSGNVTGVICDNSEQKLVPGTIPEVVDEEESTSENVEEELILYQKDAGRYKVVYNKLDGSVACCCQLFVLYGILCRHIFCVFKNCNVLKVPDQYILKRWTRDLIPPDLRRQKARYGQENEEIEKLAIEASSLVESCQAEAEVMEQVEAEVMEQL